MAAGSSEVELPEGAEKIFGRAEIDQAIDRLAADLTEQFRDRVPLVLCVMTGGLIFTGHLLTRLRFPLELDYVHVTRYRGQRSGAELQWTRTPERSLAGRHVLLLDDISDEGITLDSVADACLRNGAASVHTVALVNKIRSGETRARRADFTALEAPDRYLIGWGMDYRQRYRNLDEIYALND